MTFDQWLAANPEIWDEFCTLADEMRVHRTRWSARAILHVMRWNSALADNADDDFKINNNWSAEMARKYNDDRGVKFFNERN